jgi:glycosyltransferase involved in cell wall biosynthesis
LDRPDFLSPLQRDLPALVGRSVARAAIVCTPSDAVAQQVIGRLGVPEQRIVVPRLGVDRARSRAVAPTEVLRATLGLPPRYLLFVGAAQPRKGLDVLLEAHRSRPELAPLVHAGPAGWGPALTSSSRVHTVGYLDDADLRCVVAGALPWPPRWPAWTALPAIPPMPPPDARTRPATAGKPVRRQLSAPTAKPATGPDAREKCTVHP